MTREIPLDQFPSPAQLWSRCCAAKGLTSTQVAVTTQDYYDDGSRKSPRYYHLIAINRTVEAIALFGGKPAYLAALRDLETALYQEAA